jgi:hypothetical protein
MIRPIAALSLLAALTALLPACGPTRFEKDPEGVQAVADVPVPEGLLYDEDESQVAVREERRAHLEYTGFATPDEILDEMRPALEKRGWKKVSDGTRRGGDEPKVEWQRRNERLRVLFKRRSGKTRMVVEIEPVADRVR